MCTDTGPLKGQVSADKLSIFLAFHLTAKQRKEGKLDCVETLKRHGDGGYDSPGCKQVLHAQTCGSFISKAEWLNGHRVPAEWTSPAERCRKSPGHGQIRCGYEFFTGQLILLDLPEVTDKELDPDVCILRPALRPQAYCPLCSTTFLTPPYELRSHLILPGSCILNFCKLVRNFLSIKKTIPNQATNKRRQ